jgi:hypothetical protein
MTNDMNNDAVNHELSIDDLDAVAGGFWKELGGAILAGGVTGGLGGAAVGGVGAVPGAIGGGSARFARFRGELISPSMRGPGSRASHFSAARRAYRTPHRSVHRIPFPRFSQRASTEQG